MHIHSIAEKKGSMRQYFVKKLRKKFNNDDLF